jgi:hypothetical protein
MSFYMFQLFHTNNKYEAPFLYVNSAMDTTLAFTGFKPVQESSIYVCFPASFTINSNKGNPVLRPNAPS